MIKYLLTIITIINISCSNSKIEYRNCEECNGFRGITVDSTSLAFPEEVTDIEAYENEKKSKEENDIWQANFEKDRKCAYLINTNSNSIFKYTIKTTEASSPPSSTTKIYELYPGEEIYIDCDKYVEYERNIITRSFKVVGEIKSK